MVIETLGNPASPAIVFFHALGVGGRSSEPVARLLQHDFFVVMPTSTAFCEGQRYVDKGDEVRQLEAFLRQTGVRDIELVVASSIGADVATEFLASTPRKVGHVFFDGGQFAQIPSGTRKVMVPFLYLAIKSLYWSRGKTLGKIMWCDDDAIKPYFVEAGKALTYGNMRRLMACSLENKPFRPLPEELQRRAFWSFGDAEDHFKYRDAVMAAYPHGNFPVFPGMNHMQLQIRDPEKFAEMLRSVVERNALPEDLPVR